MDKDYQVLRFENKIKPKDIGGLGVELDARKGSGNYDKERTQFNIEYVGLDGHTNLKSKVYDTIYTNKIHFNKGDNTNLLNGCIITSGPDFFKKLGLPMKDTGRTYIEGKHIGEPIYCPDLKSKDDIPEQVYKYFNESFNFLSNFVGKENVVYAAIHLDEDTPHMHFYFLPVVNSVQRKVFETDETGKRITKEITNKDGQTKQVPIQKRDENGNLIYKNEYGKFLDSDQFWKQKGGKASFAKIQDDYNEFIISKGFDLDRGHVGANRHHQTKLEHRIKVLEETANQLENQIALYEETKTINIDTNKNLEEINEDIILSPTKNILNQYNSKDVDKLIDKAKDISKENIYQKGKIKSKEAEIKQLKEEIKNYKTGELKEKIYEQNKTINEQNETIKELKSQFEKLKNLFDKLIKKCFYVIQLLAGKKKDKIEEMYKTDEKQNFIFFENQLDSNIRNLTNNKEINKEIQR